MCTCTICCSILYGDQARYMDMELAPIIKHRNIGTLSMVNNGGNMHGSQVSVSHQLSDN